MPIQFPDFQRISFDEANPFLVGAERGQKFGQSAIQFPQDMQAKMLANQIAQVQAKYADPMAQAALTTAQQHNQFDPRIWESEIGLRGAQAGLAGAETGLTKNRSQMEALKLKYLSDMLSGKQGGMGGGQPTQGGSPNQPMQQQQPAQQTNSMYGIDIPTPNSSDIANQMLLGIDTFSPRREAAKQQVEDQYKQHQEGLSRSIQDANAASSLKQAISVFNNAMDKSTLKGQRFGNIPSSGLFTPPFMDMSSEQEADRAAIQMLPAAVATLRDAMGQARFSNLDMNMATKMKFDRTMNDETRAIQTQWVNGVNDRLMEKSKFDSLLANPQMGVKKSEVDQLWAAYQQDFPLISSDGKTFMGSNMGNWPLYTTPKAIADIRSKGSYSPSKNEKNVFMMQVPDGKGGYVIVPIKKGKVESAFKKGARPL